MNPEPHPLSRTGCYCIFSPLDYPISVLILKWERFLVKVEDQGSMTPGITETCSQTSDIKIHSLTMCIWISSGPKLWPWSHHFQSFEASISSNTYVSLYFQNQKRLAIARAVVNPSRYRQEKGLLFPWTRPSPKSRSVLALWLQKSPLASLSHGFRIRRTILLTLKKQWAKITH